MRRFQFVLADTDTTDFQELGAGSTLYRIPARRLYSSHAFGFLFMRAINWLWVALCSLYVGLARSGEIEGVYVPCSEILPSTLAGTILAATRRVPLILCNLNVRGTPGWSFNRILHRRADVVITISEALADELREAGIKAPVVLGAVGVDDGAIPTESAPSYDAVFIGRQTREKGIFDLLEIWARVCAVRPASTLVIAGPRDPIMERMLMRQIVRMQLQNRVTVLGPVSEPQKWHLYASSRLCAFPSRVEGWGIVPVEANLAGLTVVAYDLPAYRENICNSPAARLVPTGDTAAFARAVLEVLAEPSSGAKAREWALQFDWARAAAREEEILAQAVACAS